MAAPISYKKTTTTNLKIKGTFDHASASIIIDDTGEVMNIADAMVSFDGLPIELSVNQKTVEELDLEEVDSEDD